MKKAKPATVTAGSDNVIVDSEEEEENKKTANLLTSYFLNRAAQEIDYTGAGKEPLLWAALAGIVLSIWYWTIIYFSNI